MNYSRSPTQHTGKVAHAGHAPPKFRSPANTSGALSVSALSSLRRPLPPAPRNKDSSDGLTGPQGINVTACLRSFEHHIPLKHDAKYTYAADPSSPNIVYFFEYRGYGVPSPMLGALGDVYVDRTPDSYALYARGGLGWVRWAIPGWFEHPFLTDTILWLSLDSVVWIHPTMVDKHSQAADIHGAIHDMLVHEDQSSCGNQASRKQIETDGRDGSDAKVTGNGSRKRARVDEEPSTAHNSEPPASPLSAQRSVRMVCALTLI
jgi:hypothetical protein